MNKPIKLQGGKLYSKVVDRLRDFRADYPSNKGWTLLTSIHTLTDDYVIFSCLIKNPEGSIVSTGHGFNAISREKAMEKAETVSVGRALAFFDPRYGGDFELASSDEIEKFQSSTAPVKAISPAQPIPLGQIVPPFPSNDMGHLVNKAMESLTGNGAENTMPFGKYKGTPLSQLPGDYVEWLLVKMDNLEDGLRNDLNAIYQAKRPELQG